MVFQMLGNVAIMIAASVSQIEYDPQVAEIISTVSADSLVSVVSQLSGEEPVSIDGQPDSIPCRYAYSSGCERAALWLAEQLEARGVTAELQPIPLVYFLDVDVLPSGKGWACHNEYNKNLNASLYETIDFGQSWSRMDTDTFLLRKVIAVSDDTIWGLNTHQIIQSIDGGTNWKVVYQTDKSLYDIENLDGQHGWVTGRTNDYYGLVVSTTDGWTTWDIDTTLSTEGSLEVIDFVSPEYGWISTYREIWRTENGGEDWDKSFLYVKPGQRIINMGFADSLTGYFIVDSRSSNWLVFRTDDGGESWFQQDSISKSIRGLQVVSTQELWVVCDDGYIFYSSNGGAAWQEKLSGVSIQLNTIDLAGNHAVALGWSQALYTDNGDTWQDAELSTPDTLWNVVSTHPGESGNKVLITAHYDAFVEDSAMVMVYTPGADDNASGVSAVLEAARLLSDQQWHNTLEFVLFTGEEVDRWGAKYYCLSQTPQQILAFLNVDMIAYDGEEDGLIEVHSDIRNNHLSRETGEVFCDVVDIYGLDIETYFDLHSIPGDGESMWKAGIPGLSIIDFNPFYHSIEDKLDKFNIPYFTEVSKACVGWVAHMADMDSLVGIREEPVARVEDKVMISLASEIVSNRVSLWISAPSPVTPSIYDASGRRVKIFEEMDACPEGRTIKWDVSDLAIGVYWVSVPGTKGQVSRKFVKIR